MSGVTCSSLASVMFTLIAIATAVFNGFGVFVWLSQHRAA
jgi:hypothetical protein